MISGDNVATAEAIGREVGIERVMAEVLPEEKALEVRKLQEEDKRGDGRRRDQRRPRARPSRRRDRDRRWHRRRVEVADVTLISGDLRGVPASITLSRATIRNIRQNLVNTLGIPVAAGVLYPFLGLQLGPMITAAAMVASSLSVVGNANRLRGWRPPRSRASGLILWGDIALIRLTPLRRLADRSSEIDQRWQDTERYSA